MNQKVEVGIVGFGRMGGFYLEKMRKSGQWEILYICDTGSGARDLARRKSPISRIVADERVVFEDPEVQVVGLSTLADSQLRQIKKAMVFGKHVISEKPVTDTIEHEWEVMKCVENSSLSSTVNLYLRNSWYHNTIKEFIRRGEIGDSVIIRICHMTPGLVPGEGHEYRGPFFYDCGMHYVDISRWYVGCKYGIWHVQAIRIWDYPEPWWLQCHGTFENGVVFDIIQGHVYGQLSKDQTHNSYIDIIGTKGIARMSHDFKTTVVELRGVNETHRTEKPYGGKNVGTLCDLLADSVRTSVFNSRLPLVCDSAITFEYAWESSDNARRNEMPSIGNPQASEEIRERRRNMTKGYGLFHHVRLSHS